MTVVNSLAAIARQLRGERAVAGMSQVELAHAAGVSLKNVRRFETDGNGDIDKFVAICETLGLEASTLCARAGERTAAPEDAT